jgi:hypothetical protein
MEMPMRALLIVAAVALGLIAASPASAGGYYAGYFYGYGGCPWIPWWSGLPCKPYAYRPVSYRYIGGTYNYVPDFSRQRFCRTVVIETPSGGHRRVRHCH